MPHVLERNATNVVYVVAQVLTKILIKLLIQLRHLLCRLLLTASWVAAIALSLASKPPAKIHGVLLQTSGKSLVAAVLIRQSSLRCCHYVDPQRFLVFETDFDPRPRCLLCAVSSTGRHVYLAGLSRQVVQWWSRRQPSVRLLTLLQSSLFSLVSSMWEHLPSLPAYEACAKAAHLPGISVACTPRGKTALLGMPARIRVAMNVKQIELSSCTKLRHIPR